MSATIKWIMGLVASIFMLMLGTIGAFAKYEFTQQTERIRVLENYKQEETKTIAEMGMDIKYIKEAIMRLESRTRMPQ